MSDPADLPQRAPEPLEASGASGSLDHLAYVVGESPRMRALYATIQKIAGASASVLIQGENGTGKELIARALYALSPRRTRPFVTVDCAAIPEGLMESHLFGHVRGAFTGAIATVPGVFSRAHTGTLFLDEIGEMPLHLQAKLLRAIQAREVTMVGSTTTQQVDVRIICATNRDLYEAVREGKFREDLYYRIAVVQLDLPALRERHGDIPLLVTHFLRRSRAEYGKAIDGVTPQAMALLKEYPWPGNVRELENCIEQAVLLAEGRCLDVAHFPSITRRPVVAPRPAPGMSLREVEKAHILETLRHVGGNRAQAARILKISLRGLRYKLQRYAEQGRLSDDPGDNGRPGGGRPR